MSDYAGLDVRRPRFAHRRRRLDIRRSARDAGRGRLTVALPAAPVFCMSKTPVAAPALLTKETRDCFGTHRCPSRIRDVIPSGERWNGTMGHSVVGARP